MVHKAMLSSIDFDNLGVKVHVVTNSDLAVTELTLKSNPSIIVKQLPSILKNIAVYLQPLIIQYYAIKSNATLIISQNVLIPIVTRPQLVFHINVFNFVKNDGLTGKVAVLKQHLRQRASKKALIKAKVNIFESEYLYRLALAKVPSPKNAHVVYIGINESGLKNKSDIVKHENREPILVAVSSQNPHKRNHQLLEILKILHTKKPNVNWTVKLYGAISEINIPKEFDKSLSSMEKHIQFLGYTTQDTIIKTIDTSLCMICSSEIESFCTVALESMKRGTPALVSPHTSMPESVGDAGFVYDQDSPQQAAIEIIKLFENKPYFMDRARNSLKHSKTMTWNAAGTKFTQIIKEIVVLKSQST